jgi:hypothetical protein
MGVSTEPSEFAPAAAVAPSIPMFTTAPFVGSAPTLNFMDHNVPLQGIDTNKRMHTFWNEVARAGQAGSGAGHVDGHSGYDWAMPIGTPLRAVARGRVTAAFMTHPPTPCQALGQPVTDNATIEILHSGSGERILTRYIHVNSISVTVGQNVVPGQIIGTSGDRGCALSPHLHFETLRWVNNSFRVIDPYGWPNAAQDPWTAHPDGAESIKLWGTSGGIIGLPVQPALFREKSLPPNPTGSQALVTITRVRWMGINDAANPNNEFIELTLDTNFGSSVSLDGFQIKGDRANFTFNIPTGYTLTTASPTVRIHTGSGTNTATTIFMGRAAPLWSNHFDDCARRINTNTNPPLEYIMPLGGTC